MDEQFAIRCTIMRGGTSKAVFVREEDLPPPGPMRDRLLKRLLGTPHSMQIDGIGGGHLLASKIAIIGPPTVAGADLDYTFVQVEVERDVADYRGNCGNISSAVGPFAVDEGLVPVEGDAVTVRIHNTNTGNVLAARVLLNKGKARVAGDARISGVDAPGAPVFMDYLDAVADAARVLPTGNRTDPIALEDGRTISTSLCGAANHSVFVHAADVGLAGSELPSCIDNDTALLALLREIRGKAGVLLGLAGDWRRIDEESPLLPFVMIVSPSTSYGDVSGRHVDTAEIDLSVRMIFMNQCHVALAGTGSICVATASQIPGSVANQVRRMQHQAGALRIGHPSGAMDVAVGVQPSNDILGVHFEALGFVRTARRLMDGIAYVPRAELAGLAERTASSADPVFM